MVKIIDYELRTSEEGKSFYTLILQGETEIVKSENGNFYATARKCSLPCTFDEQVCESMIGKELVGSIKNVNCEPYEYINKDTGEVSILNTRNVYEPKEPRKAEPSIFEPFMKPSTNGVLEHA
ncbi:MAG: hypothetical protein R2730_05780 [Chitinophagales bacterium]